MPTQINYFTVIEADRLNQKFNSFSKQYLSAHYAFIRKKWCFSL